MASIEPRRTRDSKHDDSWRVRWSQDGSRPYETFGTEIAAKRFKLDVEEAGNRYPVGWIPGQGYASAQHLDQHRALSFATAIERYIAQRSGVQSSTVKQYRGMVATLVKWECCHPDNPRLTYRPFDRPVAEITEDDIRHWAKEFPRAEKTKANYLNGLLTPGFHWMVRRKLLAETPVYDINLDRQAIRAKRNRHLTYSQWKLLYDLADDDIKDLLEASVGTGLRWSELTALWVDCVDLDTGALTVDKAWTAKGADGEWQKDPSYRALQPLLKPKHEDLRGFYLGSPKSLASERTFNPPARVLEVLAANMAGKEADDFIFTDCNGDALHNVAFYNYRFAPLVDRAVAQGLRARPTLHDLRHTFAVWSLSEPGVNPVEVQHKLGHSSAASMERYAGYLDQNSVVSREAIDRILRG